LALAVADFSDVLTAWIKAAAFLEGMLIIGLIANLVPAVDNPRESSAPRLVNLCDLRHG
jgi:hypothetical protein